MGVKHDVADFFRRTFEESGASSHVVMYLNLANDPVVERLITPKVALTAAEYLAFEKGMHILVILTDMTSFAEAMREVSSSKGEIPSRKGYPVTYTVNWLPYMREPELFITAAVL
jgi:V/A-type H+-transporting ATPase subunit B